MKTLFFCLLAAVAWTANAAVVMGPIVNPANGYTYYLLSQNTWTRSEAEAVTLGGHLVTIRNAAEQEWIYKTFSGESSIPPVISPRAFIGCRSCSERVRSELTVQPLPPNSSSMSNIIYPRSPRETMCGWMHLPRYIDKIRLHIAGKLHTDYQANFGKGFDQLWLELAGVNEKEFIDVVRNSMTDGEVADWILKNVKKPQSVKDEQRERMLNYPKKDDTAMQDRLKLRKEQSGLTHRDDIKCFVDYIDADEKRG